MTHSELLKILKKHAKQIGPKATVKALVSKGMPPSTAEKLARGVYSVTSLREETVKRIRAVLSRSVTSKDKMKSINSIKY